jgi:hypothetical protein
MIGHNKESHKKTRLKQALNEDDYHHPQEKINQLNKFIQPESEVLEVFAGKGNLTEYYQNMGCIVTAMTKEQFGNSFDAIYQLRADKKKYDVIDIDAYGYPDKFFPVVFELIKDNGLLIFTFPIVGVNCLNGISEQHFYTFYRGIPTIGDVVGTITDFGLREWMLCSCLDVVKIKRIYRFVFHCSKKKATEMCNVKNR